MISLPTGVKIIKFYDAEMQKTGKGILYLLNNGILFEKQGNGTKFECNFDYLASFEAVKKNKLLVVIRTNSGLKSIEFKLDSKIISANQVEYDITKTNKTYARDLPLTYESESVMEKTCDDTLMSAKTYKRYDFLAEKEFVMLYGNMTAKEYDELQEYAAREKSYWPRLEQYLTEESRQRRNARKEDDLDFFVLVARYDVRIPDIIDLAGYLKERYPQLTAEQLEYLVAGLLEINKIESKKGYQAGFSMRIFDRDLKFATLHKWPDPFKKVIDVLKKESLAMKPCDIPPIDKDWKKKYWTKVNLEIAAKKPVRSA